MSTASSGAFSGAFSTAFSGVFAGKRVLVTGHTGFKGGWLCEWLLALGAEVHGLALPAIPEQLLYHDLDLHSRVASETFGDARDYNTVLDCCNRVNPDFVFHLAAQPIVRRSYRDPLEAMSTNIMGTIHMLEALRTRNAPCIAVMITSDKCYENREWLHSYRETDQMGGHDPYSASKGCAELAISSYRHSYFNLDGANTIVASARAGNVIGGGDWAEARIVPDAIRALAAGESIVVRNPTATRPWQHVLEALSGYLDLAHQLSLAENPRSPRSLDTGGGMNFGPALSSNRPVKDLIQSMLTSWPGEWTDASEPGAPHEAFLLNLATDKAFHLLGWHPAWGFDETISRTVGWYRNVSSLSAQDRTQSDIRDYTAAGVAAKLTWAIGK